MRESAVASSGHEGGGGGAYAGSAGPPQPQRRGALQLWQFLVTLLDDPNNASCIVWTGRGMEFKLVEPEEVRRVLFSSPTVSTAYNAVACWTLQPCTSYSFAVHDGTQQNKNLGKKKQRKKRCKKIKLFKYSLVI